MEKITYFLDNEQRRLNLINQIRQLPLDYHKPLMVEIKKPNRKLSQNAKLHAMLGEISKKATYLNKPRDIEFWKGLFVSGWQIATKQGCEIVPGLEGEFINIRVSTTTLNVSQLAEVIEYVYAWCADNSVELCDEDLSIKKWSARWGA